MVNLREMKTDTLRVLKSDLEGKLDFISDCRANGLAIMDIHTQDALKTVVDELNARNNRK